MSLVTPRDDDDPWLAPDKLQHVAFCFSLACVGFFAWEKIASSSVKKNPTPTTAAPQQRLLAGALLAFFGGALKELGDFFGWWPGRASPRDAAADAVGAALGLAACALYESFGCREKIAREWRRRLKLGSVDAEQQGGPPARSTRGEYQGLELSSSSAEV